MLKNLLRLESIVEGHTGHFHFPDQCPIGVLKEMLFQFSSYVAQYEANVKEALAKQEAEKAQVEQPVQASEEAPKD